MSKIKIITFLFLTFWLSSCQSQNTAKPIPKKETTMTEKFNFDEYNQLIQKDKTGRGAIYTKDDGTIVNMMLNSNPTIIEYPPNPSFSKTVKVFDEDGNLVIKGDLLGENVKVGKWKYYDGDGNLVKEEDEDAKFQNIKPNDILKFLDSKGYIDLKSGGGRFTESGSPTFILKYTAASSPSGTSEWIINIPEGKELSISEMKANIDSPGDPSNYKPAVFSMDGKSGSVKELN